MESRFLSIKEVPESYKLVCESFSNLYHAAKNLDEAGVLAHLQNGGSIDEIEPGSLFLSVGGKLAKEGCHEAAMFLYKLGANLDFIAAGTAAGNHVKQAERLRKSFGASVDHIARGAAFARNRKYAEYLRIHHEANPDNIAEGAAHAGDRDYVEMLLPFMSADVPAAKLAGVLLCAAAANNKPYVEELIARGGDINTAVVGLMIAGQDNIQYILNLMRLHADHVNLAKMALCGMFAGQFVFAEWLFEERAINPIELGAFAGAAMSSGHTAYVKYLSSKAVIPAEALFLGAALGRQNKLAQYYLRNRNTPIILSYLCDVILSHAMGQDGNLVLINDIYHEHFLAQYFMMPVILQGLAGAANFRNDTFMLHQFVFFKDKDFLKKLAEFNPNSGAGIMLVEAIQPDGEDRDAAGQSNRLAIARFVSRMSYLLPKAIRIANFMERFHFNYDEALSWDNSIELRKLFLNISNCYRDALLPLEIYIMILSHFSLLTPEDTLAMYKKIELHKFKTYICSDLEGYSHRFFASHKKRASSLSLACRGAESLGDLGVLLKYQRDLFEGAEKPPRISERPVHEQPLSSNNKNEEYYQLINKHYNRLTS